MKLFKNNYFWFLAFERELNLPVYLHAGTEYLTLILSENIKEYI